MTASTYEKLKRLDELYELRTSFCAYAKASWHVYETNTPLLWSWHHDAVCEHLQALAEGKLHKLVIALPPRHSKSSLVSVAFPTWVWIQAAFERFLTASYAMSLALRDAQRSRDLIDSQWYQERFYESFTWLPEQNQKARYENDAHGYRISTSVEGSGTGEGGSYVIIDDPHNIQEAESDALRMSVINWFDRVITSRLNDQRTGRMLVIGQRVHSQDLIGHLVETGEWEYLCLPAEYEPVRKTFTSLPWQDPRTEEGEPLWPEKFPQDVLQYLRRILVMHYFSQYQQRPTAEEGAILKGYYFFDYKDDSDAYILYSPTGEQRVLKALCRTVISTDYAVSKTQAADYTVFLVWAVTPDLKFLLREIVHDRLEAPEAEDLCYTMALSTQRLWAVVIEDVAYQKAIIQRFRRGMTVGGVVRRPLPVVSYKPQIDKVSRAQSLVIYFASAVFYFNGLVPGYAEYRRELTSFPRSKNDDRVDATTVLLGLFSIAEPKLDLLTMTEIEEEAAILEIEKDNKELAEFLRGDSDFEIA